MNYGNLNGALLRDSAQHSEVLWWNRSVSRVMLETPKAQEGCKSFDTYMKGASEELIGIYTKI